MKPTQQKTTRQIYELQLLSLIEWCVLNEMIFAITDVNLDKYIHISCHMTRSGDEPLAFQGNLAGSTYDVI